MTFDTTLKHVCFLPPNRLLSHALGREVRIKRSLPTDCIVIENVHPDVLFEDEDGEIIHAELHGYGYRKFACRNLIYFGIILRDYDRAPHQIVFWTGSGKVGVTDGLHIDERLHYNYTVIDLREFDGEFLLDGTGCLSDVVFAILCKLRDKRAAVARIGDLIRARPRDEQKSAWAELLILSGMRGLTPLVKEEMKRMPVEIDIHENEFLEGIWSKAHVEGREQGREQGREEEARDNLLRLLHHRFGELSDPAIALRIKSATFSDLKLWTVRAWAAKTAAEVFEI